MAKILLKDGVKYKLWTPRDEVKDFEPMVICHVKDIFGDGCEYFRKRALKSLANNRSIPDGFVIDFGNENWFIVELKLLGDDAIKRISDQIVSYKSALDNSSTRRKIYKSVKSIKDVPFLDDLINETPPEITIIIDNLEGAKGDQFIEKVKKTDPNIQIIEFQTFARVGCDPKKVHIHLFEPLYEIKPMPITEPSIITEEKIEVVGKTHYKTFHAFFDPTKKKIIIDGKEYSPSGAAKKLTNYPVDGWHFWKFQSPDGQLLPIDEYRRKPLKVTTQKEIAGLISITAGKFEHKGNGIFVLKEKPDVIIDAKKTTKEVIAALQRQGYTIKNPGSFYHQLRKKAGII